MAYENGEWYQVECADIDYIKSPVQGTPGLELTLSGEHGKIRGVWWLTDAINQKSGLPQWQEVYDRLMKLGCEEAKLHGDGWVEHIRKMVAGKILAANVEIDERGNVKAKFIGIPKAGGGGFASQGSAPSLFAAKFAGGKGDVFGSMADDDLPF